MRREAPRSRGQRSGRRCDTASARRRGRRRLSRRRASRCSQSRLPTGPQWCSSRGGASRRRRERTTTRGPGRRGASACACATRGCACAGSGGTACVSACPPGWRWPSAFPRWRSPGQRWRSRSWAAPSTCPRGCASRRRCARGRTGSQRAPRALACTHACTPPVTHPRAPHPRTRHLALDTPTPPQTAAPGRGSGPASGGALLLLQLCQPLALALALALTLTRRGWRCCCSSLVWRSGAGSAHGGALRPPGATARSRQLRASTFAIASAREWPPSRRRTARRRRRSPRRRRTAPHRTAPRRAAPRHATPRHAAPRCTRPAPPHLALRPSTAPGSAPRTAAAPPAQERALELLRVDAAACEAAWRAAVSAAKSPRLIAENVADSLRRARSNAGVSCFMRRTSSFRRGVEPAAAGRPQREGEEGEEGEEEHRGWRGQQLLEDARAASATGSGSGSDEDEDVSFLDSGML